MPTRESIMEALLARLAASSAFAIATRRNRGPEAMASISGPALVLTERTETYESRPGSEPRRALEVDVLLYADVGQDENAIPSASINVLLDGLDAALASDAPGTGRCTLGGLVYSAMITGEIVRGTGDISGKPMAKVPIRILIP